MSISELAAFLGAEGISGDDKEFKRELEQAKRLDFPHLYERYGSIPTSFIHTPYLPISTPADMIVFYRDKRLFMVKNYYKTYSTQRKSYAYPPLSD